VLAAHYGIDRGFRDRSGAGGEDGLLALAPRELIEIEAFFAGSR